jgi:hypothetical protein
MKDRISIILAGFTPIFCVGLQYLLHDFPDYEVIHCFDSKEDVESYIVNGGNVDLLIFADNLTDITFIPKSSKTKSLVFTDRPEKFKYDNWFYVNISGTLKWNINNEEFSDTIQKLTKGENGFVRQYP